MKDLKEVYIATFTRYNFSRPFESWKREFDLYPTKEELLDFVKDKNKKSPYKDFKSDISIDKIFRVVNI